MLSQRRRIQVTVASHGPAAELVRSGTYDVPSGCTVKKLLREAGLSRGAPALTCLIEGRRVGPSHRLTGGECLTVVQFAAGG